MPVIHPLIVGFNAPVEHLFIITTVRKQVFISAIMSLKYAENPLLKVHHLLGKGHDVHTKSLRLCAQMCPTV